MLQKLNRLRKNKDFERVFNLARSSYDRFLGVKSAPNKLTESRFAIIISNKVSKKAVVRNKIRRRIRDLIKRRLTETISGRDVVIICLNPIINLDFKATEQSIVKNFSNLGLYKK